MSFNKNAPLELELIGLIKKLLLYWRWVICSVAVGALIACSIIYFTGLEFEAKALIQAAKIGRIGQTQPYNQADRLDLFGGNRNSSASEFVEVGQIGLYTVTSRLVEPMSQTIEWIRSTAFLQDVAEGSGDAEWLSKVKVNSGDGGVSVGVYEPQNRGERFLIELKIKANSREVAERRIAVLIKAINARQAVLARPALESLRLTLGMTKQRLRETEAERDKLKGQIGNAGNQDKKFGDLVLAASLVAQSDARAFELRQISMAMQMALESSASHEAILIDAISITERPTTSGKVRFVVMGMLSGLFLMLAWIIFIDARNRKQ